MLRIIGLRTMAIVFILFYFIYVSTAISDRKRIHATIMSMKYKYDFIYTGPCISVHESLGKCVNFQRCPPFFEMLKSAHEGYITRDRLRLLQRLTCGFKGNDPMVCYKEYAALIHKIFSNARILDLLSECWSCACNDCYAVSRQD